MNIEATQTDTNSSALTWFEFEESPMIYRFAIVPQQPILIGTDENIYLVKRRDNPKFYKKILLRVDELLQKYKIKILNMNRGKESFHKEFMQTSSSHLRFEYEDKSRWIAMYDKDKIPSEVEAFIKELKSFAKEIMSQVSGDKLEEKEVLSYMKEDTVIKIKILNSNKILVNNHIYSFSELNEALDEAKNIKALVLYSRETPEKEPSELVGKTIDSVIEAIMKRGLKIKMLH